MDLNYSPEELAFRDEVRDWLSKNLPPELKDKAHLSREDVPWRRLRPEERGGRPEKAPVLQFELPGPVPGRVHALQVRQRERIPGLQVRYAVRVPEHPRVHKAPTFS